MELDYLGITLRWFHIMAAIALVGGALFQRLALLGPSSELPEETRQRLSDAIRRRWSKVVMLAILILLATGLANAILTMTPFRMAFQKDFSELNIPRPGYDILLGVKILLALVIFFITSALSGRGRATAGMRAKAAGWLSFNLLLAVILVAISGVMRSFHTGPNINKVKQVLTTQTDAPPAPALGGPSPATQPAAAGTTPAKQPAPVELQVPEFDIPEK